MENISPIKLFHRLRLKGNSVRCNLCGNTFKRFQTFGTYSRPNAMCPKCGSYESTRTLWFYLKDHVLGVKNKNRFLYVSPEKAILEQLKSYPIELSIEELDYFNMLETEKSKYKGGYFDVILFSHAIQYVKNDQKTYEELLRLLRPGGFVLLMTVINWGMERTYEAPKTEEDKSRLKNYVEPGHQRVFGENYPKILKKADFMVEKINYAEVLGEAARQYYNLGNGDREIIFKCKKKSQTSSKHN